MVADVVSKMVPNVVVRPTELCKWVTSYGVCMLDGEPCEGKPCEGCGNYAGLMSHLSV